MFLLLELVASCPKEYKLNLFTSLTEAHIRDSHRNNRLFQAQLLTLRDAAALLMLLSISSDSKWSYSRCSIKLCHPSYSLPSTQTTLRSLLMKSSAFVKRFAALDALNELAIECISQSFFNSLSLSVETFVPVSAKRRLFRWLLKKLWKPFLGISRRRSSSVWSNCETTVWCFAICGCVREHEAAAPFHD
jgi:hypothetical protein